MQITYQGMTQSNICRKGQTGVNIKINSSLKPVSKCIGTGACLSVKTHENFDVDKPNAFS